MIVQTPCLLCKRPIDMVELCRLSFGSIVRCPECGLVRVFPPRSVEHLAHLHNIPEFFDAPYFDRRDLSQANFLTKNQAVLELLVDSHTVRDAKILDIGCDTGSLLRVARDEYGMTGLGIEVSEQAARIAREEHGLEVMVGQVTEMRLPRASFDFIVLVDVVEHVADPAALLSEVYQLLRPGGKIYIDTADCDALVNLIGIVLCCLLGTRGHRLLERRLFIPYHEYYFNQDTLAQLVKLSGFQITYQAKWELPINEVHGILFKLGLLPVFGLQHVLRRQTLQRMVAVKVR
jgi:SAM-dependent methyltransferase